MQNNGKVITARYTGVVPDTFKNGSEVVLKGQLHPDGDFMVTPNGVMAKCPSKYTPQPAARHAGELAVAALGSFILLATFVVASYALAVSVAGGRRRSRPLIDSGIGAFYLTAALMSVASGDHHPRVRHR